MTSREIFITGGSGYIGRRLIPRLLERGHRVRALVRPGSEGKLPPGCVPVLGNALDQSTFAGQIAPADTFIQLVGVAHPSPAKVEQFRAIDLVSGRASVAAATQAQIQHFIYVSVAQPSPIMKEYAAVRAEVESVLRASHLNATIIRPWYVLGPGHRWPIILLPMYWLFGSLPATRDSARRLGLITLEQMLQALIRAVEDPPGNVRIWEVPQLRQTT